MNISRWPLHERPREKLLTRGAEALTDAELLAVLFGSGTRGMDGVAWARTCLAGSGSIQALIHLDIPALKQINGMGPARAAQVHAVREILTRLLRSRIPSRYCAKDPAALADYLRLSMGGEKREKFRVIFLNKKLEIMDEKELFAGTVDETPVYPREVVRHALACHATAVILAHNHPSGRIQPSPEDIHITHKISGACALVNIRVLDHLIVGTDGYFSFNGEGMLKD